MTQSKQPRVTGEDLFKPRTPEELEQLPSLTEEEIWAAIEQGKKDAELARQAMYPGRISRHLFRAMGRMGA